MPDDIGVYPTGRTTPFDPPAELAAAGGAGPLHRMQYPDGHLGWVVTGHAAARSVLVDPRFSARSELKRTPVPRPGIDPYYGQPALPGWLVDMDAPEHTRLRRCLAGKFTARRVGELRCAVDRLVADLLDAMEEAGPPIDLVAALALPVPSLTICEVLGVPPDQRAEFQHHSRTLFSFDASSAEASAAMDELYRLVDGLVGAGPGSGVLAALAAEGMLGPDEIVGIGVLLLTAGHESTTSSLALSVLALLSHPGQLRKLVTDPARVGNAVEELLRYLTVFHIGVPRCPTADVEVAGHLLRAGESVTVALPIANRDRSWFDGSPQELDIDRSATGHVAFGYGVHQCLGQNLVRLEMRSALGALFARFPGLRLAVPADEVPMAAGKSVYGVHRLPVTW